MNFRVTFNTTEQALGGMLAHFTRSQLKGVEIVPVEPRVVPPVDTAPASAGSGPGSGFPRIPGKSVLMQTGKEGKAKTSQMRRLLVLHERLEASEGIGTVTRARLGARAKKVITKFPSPGINRLVADGWLTIIGESNGDERD